MEKKTSCVVLQGIIGGLFSLKKLGKLDENQIINHYGKQYTYCNKVLRIMKTGELLKEVVSKTKTTLWKLLAEW